MFDLLFGWRNASKCKKLIKRVQCRLKLLKNKRSCIVKQLREDVAELLKHGHDRTAFERVEHVVMDEGMVHVYDLLYQYCEFVVFNLPYIRKHRDCPNDINEAISTLIFSSARFGELPELLCIRKLFEQRYGRKFVAGALELLPQNLVKKQIVEILEMKKVADDEKHKFIHEIARSCLQTEPLLLDYKPYLQEDHKPYLNEGFGFGKEDGFVDEFEYPSQNSVNYGEEVVYIDDIEEIISPPIKDENLQDQRLFVFKSLGIASNMKASHEIQANIEEREEASSRKSRKRSRRRTLKSTDIAYYGESEVSSPDIRRKSHHQKVNDIVGSEEILAGKSTRPFALRAVTMPCARVTNGITEDVSRSNSFPLGQSFDIDSPCTHIHPNLPDYDELAAKFMELKRANLIKSVASKFY